MQSALSGFFTIGAIIAVGFVVAHFGGFTREHQRLLSNLSFLVGSPALMLTVLWRADLGRVFSRSLLVSVSAVAVAAAAYLLLAALRFHPVPPGGAIGTLLACYTNAGNLGLPVAAYVLGDITWMAAIMLLQVGFMQPLALAYLDVHVARTAGTPFSLRHALTVPIRNPITLGVLSGLALNLLSVPLPALLATPLDMVAALAVPTMLIAFGISLRLDPRPTRGEDSVEAWSIVAIKQLLHPLVAFLLARYAFDLPPHDTLAVTVIAALPPAQNIFIIANRYSVRTLLARDVTFTATILSAPIIIAISGLLH